MIECKHKWENISSFNLGGLGGDRYRLLFYCIHCLEFKVKEKGYEDVN